MDSVEIILADLRKLYENGDDYNVTINIGKGETTESFKAHSAILRARCPYFRNNLLANWARREKDMIYCNISHITPEAFKVVLKYVILFALTVYCTL